MDAAVPYAATVRAYCVDGAVAVCRSPRMRSACKKKDT